MEDYRCTKYCKLFNGIEKRKNKVKQSIIEDHPRAKDMHRYVSKNRLKYKLDFIKAYNNKCGYCGVSIDLIPKSSFEIDHFIYQQSDRFTTKEDAGYIENLVLACHDCNNSKRGYCVEEVDEKELNPDEIGIMLNFRRNELFYIVPTEQAKKNIRILNFYEKLHFGSEIHRIDYLVLSMIGLQNYLKCKGIEYIELSSAISILKTKRNLMSIHSNN